MNIISHPTKSYLREGIIPRQGAEYKLRGWKPIKWGFFLKGNLLVFICILFFVLLPFQQIKIVVPDATRKRTLLIYPFFKKHLSSLAKKLCVVITFSFQEKLSLTALSFLQVPFYPFFFFSKFRFSHLIPSSFSLVWGPILHFF